MLEIAFHFIAIYENSSETCCTSHRISRLNFSVDSVQVQSDGPEEPSFLSYIDSLRLEYSVNNRFLYNMENEAAREVLYIASSGSSSSDNKHSSSSSLKRVKLDGQYPMTPCVCFAVDYRHGA